MLMLGCYFLVRGGRTEFPGLHEVIGSTEHHRSRCGCRGAARGPGTDVSTTVHTTVPPTSCLTVPTMHRSPHGRAMGHQPRPLQRVLGPMLRPSALVYTRAGTAIMAAPKIGTEKQFPQGPWAIVDTHYVIHACSLAHGCGLDKVPPQWETESLGQGCYGGFFLLGPSNVRWS